LIIPIHKLLIMLFVYKKSPVVQRRIRFMLVSSLSGVPTPAFRGREVRQVSFTPEKAQSRHCRYSDGDVGKVTLLKRLTDQGRATSNIVCLDTHALNVLLQRRQVSNQTRAREHRQYGSYQYPNTPASAPTGLGVRGSLHRFQISRN